MAEHVAVGSAPAHLKSAAKGRIRRPKPKYAFLQSGSSAFKRSGFLLRQRRRIPSD
jgi:hypothetical protein